MADFTWSYSSLKQYTNCPKQYHEIRVLKNYTVKENEAMMYGKEVHEALELYVKEGKELAKNYQRFKPFVDPLIKIKGDKYPEYEMALTHTKEPCDFHDENRWVRGIADLLIVDGTHAFVVDYKTGSKKYPDPKQLRLMSLMVFTLFPDVQSWGRFEQPLKRLEMSYDNDVWQPNPTPLCGWCSVDSCEHWRPRRWK